MAYQNDRIKQIPAPLPVDYDRQTNFTDYQTANPGQPMQGAALDAEFNVIEQALDETQARQRLIQRDDGALQNKIVTRDSLAEEVIAGVNSPTTWTVSTVYAETDSVIVYNEPGQVDPAWYVCEIGHTAVDFAADLAAGRWRLLVDLGTLLIDAGQTVVVSGTGSETFTDSLDNRWISKYTTDQLSTATSLRAGNLVRTTGKTTAGDGGTADYEIVAGGTGFADGFLFIDMSNGLQAKFLRGTAISDVTVLIPSQYADLQSAVDDLYGRLWTKSGVIVDFIYEAGHQITTGTVFDKIKGVSWKISSIDATVNLDVGFVGVNPTGDVFIDNSLFVGIESDMPELNCLVDMNDLYGCGYVATEQSKGRVAGSCGVINAGAFGLYLSKQANVSSTACNFSGAGWGNRVTTNSRLQSPSSNWSGSKNQTYLGSNTTANLDVSRGSVAYITGSPGNESDLTNSAGRGLAVRRSFCSATSVDCSNAVLEGVNAGASSIVPFNASIANNCNDGIFASGASRIDASDGVSATGCVRFALYVNGGGYVAARSADLSGAGTTGCRADNGSQANVTGANCRSGGVDAATDIVAQQGSIIHAVGATGGTFNTPLTLTTNGLIFK